ncbi:hypothetical protein B566_EDAN013618 [Ephemera danica]|nr:hypothetical protein B566_EDAN013618 [Ephemera danica]
MPPSTVYYSYLESLMRAKQIDELREVLDVMGDNVRCVASDLLSYATYIVEDEEILRDILKRNLPQHVIQSLFAELLQFSNWKPKQARIYCETHPELTRLYIHNKSSFPLLMITNEFTNRVSKANESNKHEECIRRMASLLRYGAEINARCLEETTPIHLAAKRGAWKVVEMLLAYHANIDIEIEGVTARKIIAKEKPELVENYKIQCEHKTITDKLYDALYEEDEEDFLKLLVENENFDVNIHNGKETFLQLSIIKKFKKSVEMLLKRGARINLVAGLGIEPILLAFRNPELECLKQLSDERFLLKCNISHNSGTILHELSTITLESVKNHRGLIESIIDEVPPLYLSQCVQRLCVWLRLFYYRVLLHCDEDTILKQILTNKKYPDFIKSDAFNAEKLQRGIQHHQEDLQSLKSQNEKWQQKLTNQINQNFTLNTEIQNQIMENQEQVSVNLTTVMQKQILELKKEMEQIKLEQKLQIKEVHKDFNSLKDEMLNISEQLKEMISRQKELQEILVRSANNLES